MQCILLLKANPLSVVIQPLNNTYNGAAVTGTFAGGTTWMPNLTYIVADNLTLPNGSSLTIQPGVVVKLLPTKGMTLNGQLIANGTPATEGTPQIPIVFTSLKDDLYGGDTNNDHGVFAPAPNDWGTLTFSSTSINSSITQSIIRYGGSAAIKVDLTAVVINNNSFHQQPGWYGSDNSQSGDPAIGEQLF